MEEKFMMHRQGDVLFVKVAELPSGLVERKNNVLVEGEATGHAHRLTAGLPRSPVLMRPLPGPSDSLCTQLPAEKSRSIQIAIPVISSNVRYK